MTQEDINKEMDNILRKGMPETMTEYKGVLERVFYLGMKHQEIEDEESSIEFEMEEDGEG